MFNGLLPTHSIATLTAIFGLDDELLGQVEEALLQIAGNGVAVLQTLWRRPLRSNLISTPMTPSATMTTMFQLTSCTVTISLHRLWVLASDYALHPTWVCGPTLISAWDAGQTPSNQPTWIG